MGRLMGWLRNAFKGTLKNEQGYLTFIIIHRYLFLPLANNKTSWSRIATLELLIYLDCSPRNNIGRNKFWFQQKVLGKEKF